MDIERGVSGRFGKSQWMVGEESVDGGERVSGRSQWMVGKE